MQEIFLTQGQLDDKRAELDEFINVKRKEVVERIKEAKSFGDLSENSEYDAAREEQAFVEAKIKELETVISNAQIISDDVDTESVGLGTVVTYTDLDTKEKSKYKIVGMGSDPIDAKEPSIASSTPIGRKLLGKKVGETVEVDVPIGRKRLKINKIQ